MNKRTLLLVASAILATGAITDTSVEAKVNPNHHTNGAIIQQMSKDSTPTLMGIYDQNNDYDQRFEKQAQMVEYFERGNEFDKADESFDEFVGMLLEEENDSDVTAFYTRVKDLYEELHLATPSNPRYNYKLSILEKNFGSYEDAYAYLKKALAMNPTNATFRNEYAQYALENNDYDTAIKIYKSLKKLDPKEVDYRISLAKAYTQAGMYDDAIREYRVAAVFEPENNDTIIALNELSNYAGTATYDPFSLKPYNKPTYALSRPVASPDGQRLVAFNAPERQPEMRQAENGKKTFAVGTTETTRVAKAQPAKQQPVVRRVSEVDRTQQYQQQEEQMQPISRQQVRPTKPVRQPARTTTTTNYRQVAQQQPQRVQQVAQQPAQEFEQDAVERIQVTDSSQAQSQKSSKQSKKSKKAKATGAKRVMVSYVNGRKVVKIVNINTDANTSQSLEEAPETFQEQLDNSNSSNGGYSSYNNNYRQETTAFEQPVSEKVSVNKGQTPSIKTTQGTITQTRKSDYPRENKYQHQQTSSYSDVDAYGNPNLSALSNGKRKQLVVTYKNGKKVVQVAPNGDVTNVQKVSAETKKDKKTKVSKGEKPAVQTNQNNADIYIKANELMAQRQFADVIEVLKQVQPPTLRSLTSIAACYNELKQPDVAIEYYKQADRLSPDNSKILYSIGYLYFTQNDPQSAKKYADLALKADPQNDNAKELSKYLTQQESNIAMNQAISYMNNNNYSEAKKTLEKITRENPTDFQAYYYLGHIGYATQKYEEATKNFSLAIQYNPEYALSYYSIGLAFDKLREFHHSLPAYEQFLKMETDDNKYTQYAKTRIATIRSKK